LNTTKLATADFVRDFACPIEIAPEMSALSLDDMVTDTNNPLIDPQESKRQGHRMRMARLVIAGVTLQSFVLWLYALVGSVPMWLAGAFFVTVVGLNAAILAFFRVGLNLKLREKGLLIPYILTNGFVQLLFLVLAPKLSLFFMVSVFVVFGFGVIQFTERQFNLAWAGFGVISGAALWLVKGQFGYPGVSGAEITLVWLTFFLLIGFHVLVNSQFSHLRKRLAERNQELHDSLARIEELASHDYLTGVLNRRSLIEKLEVELHRSYRTGHPFCFAILDLDYFKAVNDRFGHPVGDIVLKKVSECANKSLRTLDSFGRIGGEEFGIVLPATWLDQGMIAMMRLRKAVAEYDWESVVPGLRVTFSVGITTNAPGDTTETIGKRADDALYKAKQEGRDQIVAAEETLPEMPAMEPDGVEGGKSR
jgi:diguanylate cyclase (GGDEF)-like protein